MSITIQGEIVFRKQAVADKLSQVLVKELGKMNSKRDKTFGESFRENRLNLELSEEWAKVILTHVGEEQYRNFGKSKNVKWSRRLSRVLRQFGWQIHEEKISEIASDAFISSFEKGIVATIKNFGEWEAGRYGDKQSCFFDERRAIQPLLRDIGIMAIVFEEAETNHPIGRCLVVRNHVNDTLLLFNFYSVHNSVLLEEYIARRIDPQGVCPTVSLRTNGILYINSDSAIEVPIEVFGDDSNLIPSGDYSIIRNDFLPRKRYYVEYEGIEDYKSCGTCGLWFLRGVDDDDCPNGCQNLDEYEYYEYDEEEE